MTQPTGTFKAVISNRIYLRPENTEHRKQLTDDLTYTIEVEAGYNHRSKKSMKRIEVIRNFKVLPGGIISIPQGRTDLIPNHYEIVDKRIKNEVPFPLPLFELRDSQQPVYDEVFDSCFINALVGWGKTFTALYLAKKLGQKTLVITHTTALRDQWREEVLKLYGIRAGVIGSGLFDIEDHCIVVANVQTAVKLKDSIAKEFGLLILDEAHHCPAETFSELVDSSHARYRIALSGTMLRKDGKHVVFRDYFGSHVIKPPQSNTLNPTIRHIKSGVFLPPGKGWAAKINDLLYDSDYQELIAAIAIRQIEKGHKVLITASRVEFLERIQDLIGEENCILITGKLAGPEGFAERKRLLKQVEDGEKSCIAASRQIFTEGISVNILSCCILAEPTSNPIILEQLIGRIQRLHDDKPNPLVIDIGFSSPSERKQYTERKAFYLSKGWEVDEI